MRVILVVGFVLVCLALGSVAESPAKPTLASVTDPTTVQALEKVLNRALAAYNSIDLATLRASFSSTAPGLVDEGTYHRLFVDYYLADFGRLKGVQLVPKESKPDPDRAMLVYAASFDKVPKAKLSANFIRENGQLKLVQLRFEK